MVSVPAGYSVGSVCGEDAANILIYTEISFSELTCGNTAMNSESAYTLYKSETQKPYFVDKSQMIEELFPLIEEGANHICITRPRRFGKTVMANMISAFFSRAREASDIFDRLKISASRNYSKYRNQYNVIHISLNDISTQCTTYREYITRIEHRLVRVFCFTSPL